VVILFWASAGEHGALNELIEALGVFAAKLFPVSIGLVVCQLLKHLRAQLKLLVLFLDGIYLILPLFVLLVRDNSARQLVHIYLFLVHAHCPAPEVVPHLFLALLHFFF
jgi:hypothetical protein